MKRKDFKEELKKLLLSLKETPFIKRVFIYDNEKSYDSCYGWIETVNNDVIYIQRSLYIYQGWELSNVEYTIICAIMAGVVAGNIEGMGKGFIDDFGADSINHCYEYLNLAEQYDLPWDENNEIATDCVHNDISDLVWMKYADNMPLKEIKTKWGSIYIEELFSKREEEERIKIYDSNKKYMDYFDVEHLQDCANEMGHSLRWEYCTRINNFTEANYIEDLANLIYTDLHASYITKNWAEGAEFLGINISHCTLTDFKENEYVNQIGDYYVILSD